MRVRMLINYQYLPDGINPVDIKAGQIVDVPESVAMIWLKEGKAEEDKSLDGPPEVKNEAITLKPERVVVRMRAKK